eukprot:6175123-Pleurochrysis_carterae.AAC.1
MEVEESAVHDFLLILEEHKKNCERQSTARRGEACGRVLHCTGPRSVVLCEAPVHSTLPHWASLRCKLFRNSLHFPVPCCTAGGVLDCA